MFFVFDKRWGYYILVLMKKIMSKITKTKKDNITSTEVVNLMIKNSATKSDIQLVRNDLKLVEKNLKKDLASKEDLKSTEENIRADIKEELKRYATREEMAAMERRLVDTMSLNTNKILGAVEKIVNRVERIEEKVF